MDCVGFALGNLPIRGKSPELERLAGNMKKIDYPVGDFLIRLKNAAMAGKKEVVVPKTNLIKAVSDALKDAKYLNEVKQADNKIVVSLAFAHKEPVLTNIKLISRPGLRIYESVDQIKSHKGPYLLIVSTSKGVLTSKKAMKEGLGGEVIAEVL